MVNKSNKLQQISTDMRRTILKMTNHAGAGHVGGSLSEIDILTALYFSVMNIDPQNPSWEDRDRFILSKGHASPGYYTVLAHKKYFDMSVLDTFDQVDSKLQAHPDMHKCPGVDYSVGSLGQGLSVGIGMALGAAHNKKSFKTFVLLGDGESQEGQVWEALMYAGAKKVKNIIVIFDYNKVQLSSPMAQNTDLYPLAPKLCAFNWKVFEVDGHDMEKLEQILTSAAVSSAEGPVAVIAHTVKGKGVSFMEGDYHWHGQAPNDEQLVKGLAELEGGCQL